MHQLSAHEETGLEILTEHSNIEEHIRQHQSHNAQRIVPAQRSRTALRNSTPELERHDDHTDDIRRDGRAMESGSKSPETLFRSGHPRYRRRCCAGGPCIRRIVVSKDFVGGGVGSQSMDMG